MEKSGLFWYYLKHRKTAKKNRKPITIYALIDPRTKRVRYIGKTISLKQRFNDHMNYPMNQEMRCWMQDLKAAGFLPEVRELETVVKGSGARQEKAWIRTFKDHDLLNCAWNGGHRTSRVFLTVPVSGERYAELVKDAEAKGIGVTALIESKLSIT